MTEQEPIRILSTSSDICELGSVPKKQIWGEPVTRPDGTILTIEVHNGDEYITCNVDAVGSYYGREEILLLGKGDFDSGVAIIGQAIYRDPSKGGVGLPRALNEDIKKLKAR